MTEQEAEVFAERLTRIWATKDAPTPKEWGVYDGYFTLYYDLLPDVKVAFFVPEQSVPLATLRHGYFELICHQGHFSEDYDLCEEEELPSMKQFAVQWMDIFRCNCWLSGCPIEASAHEKAEWMQGFSREEIEALNLKL